MADETKKLVIEIGAQVDKEQIKKALGQLGVQMREVINKHAKQSADVWMKYFTVMEATRGLSMIGNAMQTISRGYYSVVSGFFRTAVESGRKTESSLITLTTLLGGNQSAARRTMYDMLKLVQLTPYMTDAVMDAVVKMSTVELDVSKTYGKLGSYTSGLTSAAKDANVTVASMLADISALFGRPLERVVYGFQRVLMREGKELRVIADDIGLTTAQRIFQQIDKSTNTPYAQQVMENLKKFLMEKGALGMSVRLSRSMQGVLTNFKELKEVIVRGIIGMPGEGGILDSMTKSLNAIYDRIAATIDSDKFKQAAKRFGETLKPITDLLGGAAGLGAAGAAKGAELIMGNRALGATAVVGGGLAAITGSLFGKLLSVGGNLAQLLVMLNIGKMAIKDWNKDMGGKLPPVIRLLETLISRILNVGTAFASWRSFGVFLSGIAKAMLIPGLILGGVSLLSWAYDRQMEDGRQRVDKAMSSIGDWSRWNPNSAASKSYTLASKAGEKQIASMEEWHTKQKEIIGKISAGSFLIPNSFGGFINLNNPKKYIKDLEEHNKKLLDINIESEKAILAGLEQQKKTANNTSRLVGFFTPSYETAYKYPLALRLEANANRLGMKSTAPIVIRVEGSIQHGLSSSVSDIDKQIKEVSEKIDTMLADKLNKEILERQVEIRNDRENSIPPSPFAISRVFGRGRPSVFRGMGGKK